jgi:hypothetical protein
MATQKTTEARTGGTKKKTRTSKNHKRSRTIASRRDKYDCYQRSVQEPESQCRFFERVFRNEYGRRPLILREDFCGTAAVCCEWVRKKPDRRACGYDLDPEPLAWGEEHNRAPLDEEARSRVKLIREDVRKVTGPKADVVSAENFSYFIFTTRDELRGYLQAARRNLADEGVMVLDIMGGSEVIEEDREETRRVDGFTYIWEHKRFDPINNLATYFIHFKFRDGSKIKRAFRYDWRVWTIPELRELLLEAGFSRVDVYWEGADEDGDGNGIFRRQKSAPADPAWIAYVVAVK